VANIYDENNFNNKRKSVKRIEGRMTQSVERLLTPTGRAAQSGKRLLTATGRAAQSEITFIGYEHSQ